MIAVVLAVLFPQGVGLRRDLPQRHRVRKSREDAVFCRRVAGVIGREKKRDFRPSGRPGKSGRSSAAPLPGEEGKLHFLDDYV
jgi:hypothetical protein